MSKFKFLLHLMLIGMYGFAFAGAKGLDVIVVNIGDVGFYVSPSFNKFLNNFDRMNHDDCWGRYGIGDKSSGIYYWTQKNFLPELTRILQTRYGMMIQTR